MERIAGIERFLRAARGHGERVLAAYGVPVPREVLVRTPAEAAAAARRIRSPVSLKACAAGQARKTEKGLEHNVAGKAWLEPRGVPCYMQVEDPFEVLTVLARCGAVSRRRSRAGA